MNVATALDGLGRASVRVPVPGAWLISNLESSSTANGKLVPHSYSRRILLIWKRAKSRPLFWKWTVWIFAL